MADVVEPEQPDDEGDGDAELSYDELASLTDEALRELLKRIQPDVVMTGRFVVLVDSIDGATGERTEPWFLIGADQAEWETRGLLAHATARQDTVYVGLYSSDE